MTAALGQPIAEPDGKGRLKVFVSYSRRDSNIVDQLVDRLSALAVDTLVDRHDIAPGEDWQARLGALILVPTQSSSYCRPTPWLRPFAYGKLAKPNGYRNGSCPSFAERWRTLRSQRACAG
jgi:hypothetical protein